MHNAGILTRERIDSYERWELPSVDGARASVVEVEVDDSAARLPTVAELEAIEREAREEGFKAGLAEGRAMAKRELVAQTARLEKLYTAVEQPLADFDASVASELAQLATLIAERVLGFEISTRPERMLDVVRQAVEALPANARHLRVFLHPDDAALVRDHQSGGEHTWQVLDDIDLLRGDCRLESENSRLDASVRARLAVVVDAVLGEEERPAPFDESQKISPDSSARSASFRP
jgi:flagellar assembly protein FliH